MAIMYAYNVTPRWVSMCIGEHSVILVNDNYFIR